MRPQKIDLNVSDHENASEVNGLLKLVVSKSLLNGSAFGWRVKRKPILFSCEHTLK